MSERNDTSIEPEDTVPPAPASEVADNEQDSEPAEELAPPVTTPEREADDEELTDSERDPLVDVLREPARLTRKPKDIFANPFGEPKQPPVVVPPTPISVLAREQTPEFKIQANNPGALDDWANDPTQRDMMALTKEFRAMGDAAKQRWMRADATARKDMTRALVSRVAASEWEGYNGKDINARVKQSEKRLGGATIGLDGLIEFGAKSKAELAEEAAKKEDDQKGALSQGLYIGSRVQRGVVQLVGGLMKAAGLASDDLNEGLLAHAQEQLVRRIAEKSPEKVDEVKGAFGEFKAGLGIGEKNVLSHAGDALIASVTRTPGKHDVLGDSFATRDQLALEDKFHEEAQKGVGASVKFLLAHPRLFISEGSELAGMMLGPIGEAQVLLGLGKLSLMRMSNVAFKEELTAAAAAIGKGSTVLKDKALNVGTTGAGFTGLGVHQTGALVDAMDIETLAQTPGFQQHKQAMLGASPGKRITDEEVRAGLKAKLERDDLPRQALFQALFLGLGAHPAQALAESVGAQTITTLLGRSGTLRGAAIGGVGGAGQAAASVASSMATVDAGGA